MATFGQKPGLTRARAYRRAEALTDVGRRLFFDPALSASGKISCATCHDPDYAYGPPNADAVQQGGGDLKQRSFRAAPSLRYRQVAPSFTEHYFDGETTGDDSVDNGPTGGLTWDGRVDRGRDQARLPLLSKFEMANDNAERVVANAKKAGFFPALRALAGKNAGVEGIFSTILEALEAWQEDYREFYPYSSKYDAFLAGKTDLSPSERRGLLLFTSEDKGDCARCHPAAPGVNGTPPQFTDYGFVALGIPRNMDIPANSESGWYDLGLCGPERKDLQTKDGYCGRFMAPSLRNVALRKVFFHNGAIKSLQEAVAFYVLRDSKPERWYPLDKEGRVIKFNDLPQRYRPNVETAAPFGGKPGSTPALTDTEIGEIVDFLKTLTDGFDTISQPPGKAFGTADGFSHGKKR